MSAKLIFDGWLITAFSNNCKNYREISLTPLMATRYSVFRSSFIIYAPWIINRFSGAAVKPSQSCALY